MNRREHYRIIYPLKCRAKLTIFGKEYEVLDIAENGVRFAGKELNEFKTGRGVKFQLTFDDGESLALEGEILRVDNRRVIIYLSESIPMARIMQEQRYIRDNCPQFIKE